MAIDKKDYWLEENTVNRLKSEVLYTSQDMMVDQKMAKNKFQQSENNYDADKFLDEQLAWLDSQEKKDLSQEILNLALDFSKKINQLWDNFDIQSMKDLLCFTFNIEKLHILKNEWNTLSSIAWDFISDENIAFIEDNLSKIDNQDIMILNKDNQHLICMWNYIIYIEWEQLVNNSILNTFLILSQSAFTLVSKGLESKIS